MIAEENNRVEVLLCHIAMSNVVAVFIVLAGGKSETHPRTCCLGQRCGSGFAYWTRCSSCVESVEIMAVFPESLDFDVNRMSEARVRTNRSALYDVLHRIVARDFPYDRNAVCTHASVRLVRLWCEPCPQNRPVGHWVARPYA